MDKEALVSRSDRIAEGRIVDAISRAKIKITLVEWIFVPQLGEWQLVIATPLYDTLGPSGATRRIVDVLVQNDAYRDAPMRRVTIRSPSDPLVQSLEAEKAFAVEGVLHITKHKPEKYSVIFTPFRGPGGAVPARRFDSTSDLHTFLEKEIKISSFGASNLLQQLAAATSALIPNVVFTPRKLKNLGLA